MAYVGFDVSISQSDISEHHEKIVKRGSVILRRSIWTYLRPSIRFILALNDYYHKKKSEGKHHKVALTHVYRKFIRIICHIECNQIDFDNRKIK